MILPERPLRVLTFLHSFEPGGVERVALRLNAAWVARGIDARVVMGRGNGATRAEAPALDYDILDSGVVPTARWETLWMLLRLPAVIRRVQPDVLFCAGNSYSVVAVVMKLWLGRRCPPIVAKISNDLQRLDLPAPIRRIYHQWTRLQGKFIDHFVGMAEPMRAEMAELIDIDPARISIIEDPALAAADLQRIAAVCAPPRPAAIDVMPPPAVAGRRFLSVGRLAAQKNYPLLLTAFARMARPADRLTILGDGAARGALEKLADKLGIAAQLDLPGHVNPLDPWLAASDMFVMSSDYEGVPAVLIEAMAAGLPIVVTDCCVSMAALLDRGTLGTMVAVGDAAALAQAMDAPAPSGFSPAAAQAQAARFTVENAAGHYLQLLQSFAPVAAQLTLFGVALAEAA